ncbi:ADP-ribosyltransferase domain-containing protein [Erwinia mallotivora]|uniref:ADP-ribosyltransferase domain-containing protein n=1 Tax=Erwinia mallotivora TaxID=69222 RepID=UPI0035E9611A
MAQFNADKNKKTETVYKLGQFFSTSRDENVAKDFAKRSPDYEKIIFKVKGNSSNGLSIPGGLLFENYEGERLYSPHANFKVTAVFKEKSNTYNFTLEEVTKGDKAQLLPY